MANSSIRGATCQVVGIGTESFVMPPGFVARPGDRFRKESDGVYLTRKDAKTVINGVVFTVPGGTARISPPFTRRVTLRVGWKAPTKIVVQTATSPHERLQCTTLFNEVHYLGASPGVFVYAAIDDGPIGALALSRLPPHMRPAWRRELEKEWGEFRDALWIRRICVAKEHQGKGVGTLLAKCAVSFAKGFWLPKPELVEVIATSGGHKFLNRAGYKSSKTTRREYIKIS